MRLDIKSCQANLDTVTVQNSPYLVIDLGLFRRAVEDASPYNLCILTLMHIYSLLNAPIYLFKENYQPTVTFRKEMKLSAEFIINYFLCVKIPLIGGIAHFENARFFYGRGMDIF